MSQLRKDIVVTAKKTHDSEEGLLKDGSKTIYDDFWLHSDILDPEVEKSQLRHIRGLVNSGRVKKSEQLVISLPEPVELVLDLSKARTINRAKLVKRPVQVRGKNGKVFTRMQWVDPKTGMPVSQHHTTNAPEEHKPSMSRKEFIDKKVKDMPTDEKYAMLDKHNIKWEHNDHPAILHKNKVVALKDHLYKNPHLAGAEHLPEDKGHTPDGTDKINDWTNRFKNDPAKLYELMGKFGISDKDPRLDPNDKAAAIKHMHNMMKLKAYLKDNPHVMEGEENQPSGHTAPKPESKPKGIAERGGNTVDGILKNMSADELYTLMKNNGIADSDPRANPGDKAGPIKHMHNMMKLKALIAKDPNILNLLPSEVGAEPKPNGNFSDKGSEFIAGLSKEMKKKLIKEYADEEIMKNRNRSDDANIDYMHAVTALKKLFNEDPHLIGEHEKEVEVEQLMKYKIGNKNMAKVLRGMGLKNVGDVKIVEDGVEWAFANGFVRRELDDEGEPMLSAVYMGKDGTEWHEYAMPVKDAKELLDGKEAKAEPVVPLHEQPLATISSKLDEDFDANYTKEVGNVIAGHMLGAWTNSGQSAMASGYAHKLGMGHNTFLKFLEQWGIKAPPDNIIDTNDDKWKNMVYHSMTDRSGRKSKNANDLIYRDPATGFSDPFPLHESAKRWNQEDRDVARGEVIHSAIEFESTHFSDHDNRHRLLTRHIQNSIKHVPFDLMTHVFAKGCKVKFTSRDAGTGGPIYGAYFMDRSNRIDISSAYYNDSSIFNDHPMTHRPSSANTRVLMHNFSDTMAHEFGHAIDNFLSGGKSFLKWDNEIGNKYVDSKHTNCVIDSYRKAVDSSNPDHEVGHAQEMLYHKDNWLSSYEGRIYDGRYYGPHGALARNRNTGKLYDAKFKDGSSKMGVEHWAECSSRYANAKHSYEIWKAADPGRKGVSMDEWAEKQHAKYGTAAEDYENKSYATSYRKALYKGTPQEVRGAYGWLYHEMKSRHPEFLQAIESIYHNKDFKEWTE